ncbi:MAG: hypothetical protein Kow0042_20350 [Calditrichia bacterium]
MEQAAEKAEQVLAMAPDNPEANIILGLTLLEKRGLENRIKARELIEENTQRLRDDAFSYYALGILHKKSNSPVLARKNLEKALAKNPEFIEALIELGDIHFQEMMKYYNKLTDTRVALSFREYAIDDYDLAVDYLQRAIKLDPGNKRAVYLLGNVYLEMEEFQEMVHLFDRALERQPRDKDLNLFKGLAYLKLHEYDTASVYFDRAVEEMSEAEKNIFLNPKLLLRDDDLKVDNPAQVDTFWEQKDPMFLTEENERLLAHYGRVAYANMRFGLPEFAIEGWQTDRGKTFIRYGKPTYIIDYGKSMDFNAIYSPTQIWVYPGFHFYFTDEFWNGNYQFTQPFGGTSIFKERTTVNYSLVAEDIFQTVPETFEFELPGGSFSLPYQIVFFRGKENTDIILSFGLPWEDEIDYAKLEYTTGFFLLGEDQLPAFRLEENLIFDYQQNKDILKNRYLINNLEFEYKPGQFPYSFEVLNKTLKKNFVSRNNMEIPDYGGNRLKLSDILLAYDISPSEMERSIHRRGMQIIPNIEHIYQSNETLYLYFEVYNLLPDPSGTVHYIVENSVTVESGGNFLGKILGNRKQEISLINEYSGTSPSDFVVQSIDISNLKEGEYVLEILIKDKIAFEESRKQVTFWVKNTFSN